MKKKPEQENIKSYPGFDYSPLNKPLKVGEEILSNIFGSQKQFCYGIGMNTPHIPFLLTKEKDSSDDTNQRFFQDFSGSKSNSIKERRLISLRDLTDGYISDLIEKKGPHKYQCLLDETIHNSENQIFIHMKSCHINEIIDFLSSIQKVDEMDTMSQFCSKMIFGDMIYSNQVSTNTKKQPYQNSDYPSILAPNILSSTSSESGNLDFLKASKVKGISSRSFFTEEELLRLDRVIFEGEKLQVYVPVSEKKEEKPTLVEKTDNENIKNGKDDHSSKNNVGKTKVKVPPTKEIPQKNPVNPKPKNNIESNPVKNNKSVEKIVNKNVESNNNDVEVQKPTDIKNVPLNPPKPEKKPNKVVPPDTGLKGKITKQTAKKSLKKNEKMNETVTHNVGEKEDNNNKKIVISLDDKLNSKILREEEELLANELLELISETVSTKIASKVYKNAEKQHEFDLQEVVRLEEEKQRLLAKQAKNAEKKIIKEVRKIESEYWAEILIEQMIESISQDVVLEVLDDHKKRLTKKTSKKIISSTSKSFIPSSTLFSPSNNTSNIKTSPVKSFPSEEEFSIPLPSQTNNNSSSTSSSSNNSGNTTSTSPKNNAPIVISPKGTPQKSNVYSFNPPKVPNPKTVTVTNPPPVQPNPVPSTPNNNTPFVPPTQNNPPPTVIPQTSLPFGPNLLNNNVNNTNNISNNNVFPSQQVPVSSRDLNFTPFPNLLNPNDNFNNPNNNFNNNTGYNSINFNGNYGNNPYDTNWMNNNPSYNNNFGHSFSHNHQSPFFSSSQMMNPTPFPSFTQPNLSTPNTPNLPYNVHPSSNLLPPNLFTSQPPHNTEKESKFTSFFTNTVPSNSNNYPPSSNNLNLSPSKGYNLWSNNFELFPSKHSSSSGSSNNPNPSLFDNPNLRSNNVGGSGNIWGLNPSNSIPQNNLFNTNKY